MVSRQLQPGAEASGGALRASGPLWCLVQNSDCRNWKESGGACDARTTGGSAERDGVHRGVSSGHVARPLEPGPGHTLRVG